MTVEVERRQHRRTDRLLIIAQGVTGVAAVGLLVLSLMLNNASRINGRLTTCQLLRAVVLIATPPARQAQAIAFVNLTPLQNCDAFAHNVPFKHGRYK